MRSVNIAALKDHLSSYLNQVREGEEILIRDRNVPIAKIVPLSPADDSDAEEMVLAAAGKLKPRQQTLPETFWSMPAPRVSLKKTVAAVTAERDED
jgi:prevent-host-death family protein